MTENEKEYLDLARAHLLDAKIDEALLYYFKAGEENPDNAEAEFFSAYLGYEGLLKKGDRHSAANAFKAMTKCSEKAVKCLKNSEGTAKEKSLVLLAMVNLYSPIAGYLISKGGCSSLIEPSVLGLYAFGNAIKKEFGSDAETMKRVIVPWKEAIALQRKFYANKYNGIKPETYAEEIKKIDPTYTMPNKAGCISLG